MQQLVLFEAPKPEAPINKYDDYAWHWTWNSSQHQLKLSIGQRCLADTIRVLNTSATTFEEYDKQKASSEGVEWIETICCDTTRGKTWFEVEILATREHFVKVTGIDHSLLSWYKPSYLEIIARIIDSYDGEMIGEIIHTRRNNVWVHKSLIPPLPSC